MSGYVSSEITDPRLRLTNRVCSSLIKENTHGERSEEKASNILHDLHEVKKLDPEYIGQLAYYSRQVLGIRKTANFLLAYLAVNDETLPYLAQYMRITAKSPLDLMDVVEMVQTMRTPRTFDKHYHIPLGLKVAVQEKFAEFDTKILAKYCSEGRRKRVLKKLKDKKQKELEPIFKLCMKQLVRLCHIKRPACHVMAILGKKYPSTIEEFESSLLNETGTFEPERAGSRMKLPIASSVEVLISLQGNKAETWEAIIKNDWLPLKDILKNIKNIMVARVDEEATQLVLGKLTDPASYKRNKFFPIKFYSAYEAALEVTHLNIKEAELEQIKLKQTPQSPFLDWLSTIFNIKRPASIMRGRRAPAPKKIIKKAKKLSPEVGFRYISALEAAVKMSMSMNVSKLLGHSVIFCDVSGSMRSPIATARNIGSVRSFIEVGIMLGLMLKQVCESSEFLIFSSPSGGKCWMPVQLSQDGILSSINEVLHATKGLGQGTDFPFDYLEGMISSRTHIDQLFILSDMMISPGHNEMSNCNSGSSWTVSSILDVYRREVNPNMRFISVDLAGKGSALEDQDANPNNLLISGYSDSIMRLVSDFGKSQVDVAKEESFKAILELEDNRN
mmetsp:Transcript_9875/g.19573  ORF Transcript_9875/g.19573 Transcript_9875/m.19573 type:complete len:616 (+) Transcript_9875:833-2680(+)